MMRRTYLMLLIVSLLLIIPSVNADGSWSVDLVAGQNTTIGTVTFTITGATLDAAFEVTSPGWCMSTTHLYVGDTSPEQAAPGQFTYQHEGLDCVTSDSYSVDTPDGDVYVAAHADSHFDPDNVDDSADELSFDGISGLTVYSASDSYFTADVTGILEGSFTAWCVDLGHLIYTGTAYTANTHDSTQDMTGIVDKPENMDLVNYIINQDYVAQGYSAYNVQVAIWLLIDNTAPYIISSDALAIKADAEANGEGYVPGPGEKMGIILEPLENDAQHILIEYVIPVVEPVEGTPRSETAWSMADWGIAFDQGWGMYFQLVDAPDEEPPANDPPPTEPPPPADDPAPEPPPATPEPPRNRNDEAPGQDKNNAAPGSRSDEAPGQNGQGNGNNGQRGNSQNHRGG